MIWKTLRQWVTTTSAKFKSLIFFSPQSHIRLAAFHLERHEFPLPVFQTARSKGCVVVVNMHRGGQLARLNFPTSSTPTRAKGDCPGGTRTKMNSSEPGENTPILRPWHLIRPIFP